MEKLVCNYVLQRVAAGLQIKERLLQLLDARSSVLVNVEPERLLVYEE